MKVNWMAIQSVSDLKALGTLKEVKEILSHSIGSQDLITGTSFDQLFQKLVALQRVVQANPTNQYETLVPVNSGEDRYFQSTTSELLFYLLELDGESRMSKLGITAQLFMKKAEAKKWYRTLAKQIHPDTCHHVKATQGMEVLNDLYAQLLGE